MSSLLLISLVCFFLAIFITWQYLGYAVRQGVMDVPNDRSSHAVPTPRGGGVAIIIAFFFGILAYSVFYKIQFSLFLALTLGPGLVGLVGFIDDHISLKARWRFLNHCFASVLSLVLLENLPSLTFGSYILSMGLYAVPVLSIGVIWFLNLFNFMDGIDGIAASQSITMCIGGTIILLLMGSSEFIWLPVLIAASSAGFLVWNWSPAKVFMGDSASGFLGILLAITAIYIASETQVNFFAWLILAAVFVSDSTFTLIRRAVGKQKVYEAHRSHAYQRASRQLNSHGLVSVSVVLINIVWLLPMAYLACRYENFSFLILLMAYLPVMALVVGLGAGREEDE